MPLTRVTAILTAWPGTATTAGTDQPIGMQDGNFTETALAIDISGTARIPKFRSRPHSVDQQPQLNPGAEV